MKEDRLEAHGERLLQDLVNQEKSLVAKVEDAKAKGRDVVEKAQAEAAAVLTTARDKAEKLAQAEAESGRAEAEAAHATVVKAATEAAEALKLRAEANRAAAIDSVLEKVLP